MKTIKEFIKSEDDVKKLLEICITTAHLLIKNGAEAYRVEDTIYRICKTCNNLDSIDVFSISTAVIITLGFNGEKYSVVVRESKISIGLDVINAVNQVSRDFNEGNMSLDSVLYRLKYIEKNLKYNNNYKPFAAGVTSAFFSVMFGGDIRDFLCSLLIGFIVYYTIMKKPVEIPIFFQDLFSGLFSAGLSALVMILGLGSNLDMIIIGTIMPYVPGVVVTTGIRDIMGGEYYSGTLLAIKAVFCALAIALGVGVVLALYI